MQQVKEKDFAPGMREIQASLEKLERREWWRWATALLIMLLLTLGVLSLALPEMKRDAFQLNAAVPGLIALVLIFDVFAVYQQAGISRLRRQLSGQIGMLAALEVLKPPALEEQKGWKERRRVPRRPFDQRLIVKATVQKQEVVLYGRIIDISERGLGAVISGSLNRGDAVSLEFSAGPANPTLCLAAVIRCARGFRHGFEFAGLSDEQLDSLRACFSELAASA